MYLLLVIIYAQEGDVVVFVKKKELRTDGMGVAVRLSSFYFGASKSEIYDTEREADSEWLAVFVYRKTCQNCQWN